MDSFPNTPNGDRNNFTLGYGSLPANKQIVVRDFIIADCGWKSLMTFHNKRKGITRIRPLEADVIERHFAPYDIDPWTGSKILVHESF